MLKQDELTRRGSCLNKALSDEPLFILRAKDSIAPVIVRLWARFAAIFGAHEGWKIQEALKIAEQMKTWRDDFKAEEKKRLPQTGRNQKGRYGETK